MKVQEYLRLIDDFLKNKIGISDFEKKYLYEFKNQKEPLGEGFFPILNDFFTDVECYDANNTPENEDDFNITEETLRKRAHTTLETLKAYGKKTGV